ncbi:hypothetical protein SAMN05216516_10129 [Izhakiella capsodis]|uniref:Uncharacterized protein n=1 Tax=Izhakiella capsodis TaxID=1367852 RepID=A0A1I4UBS0_9GAMM|nr:hypothetical protein [Izhakiella capsodis]SFM86404.1 hypothetical protein SAMN05216516_10129 [Izhakiella capsodis]
MRIIKHIIPLSLVISSNIKAYDYKEKNFTVINPGTTENYDLATLDILSVLRENAKEANKSHIKKEYNDMGKSESNFNRSGPSGVDNSVTISSTNNKPDLSGNENYFNNHYNNYYNNFYNNFYNNQYNNNYNNHYNNDYNNNYNNNHHNNNGNNNGNNNNNNNGNNNKKSYTERKFS